MIGGVNILGLHISKKTDVLALTAFVISIITLSFQLIGNYLGPNIYLHSPAQVRVLASDESNSNSEESILEFIFTLSYSNSASSGHNGVIREEEILVEVDNIIADKSYFRLSANEFVTSIPTIDEAKFNLINRSTAGPFVVAAGGATTHETKFGPPSEVECSHPFSDCVATESFLTLNKFKDYYFDIINSTTKRKWFKLNIRIRGLDLDDEIVEAECNAIVTSTYFQELANSSSLSTVLPCDQQIPVNLRGLLNQWLDAVLAFSSS